MTDGVDRYDVEAMIRDAGYRYALRPNLDELVREVEVLRGDVAELRGALDSAIRILNERTADLV